MKAARKIKVTCLPLTKARIHLGEVIRRTHRDKHYFILEKDGIPVAGLMDIDEFEDFLETKAEQEDSAFQSQIRDGFHAYRKGRTKTTDEFFASLQRRPAK
jgi:prevent-host-death family protein